MKPIRLVVDRFEGVGKGLAVLLTDEGVTVDFPRSLLPDGVRGGDILMFTIVKDHEGTRAVSEQTRQIQAELQHGDDGEDIKL